jgi:hypothetical protein
MISQPIIVTVISIKLLYVDEHCHAVEWPSKSLGANHCKVTVMLYIDCYTMRKNINMNHPFLIPKHLIMYLPADICVLIPRDAIACWTTLIL